MSLVYIIGETLILAHSLWTSPPTYTTALFLLFLANSIAVASGWMLHSYRRKEFLAQELEQKARAEAEIQLAERKRVEEQLWITLERIKDGFFACDAEWRFLYVNAQAERILGICREEVLGKSHWEVFPLTLGTNIESEYRLAAAGEMRNFENFYEPWSHWFHNRCFPREGGGMSVYFEDITERKQAEKEATRRRSALVIAAPAATDASAILWVLMITSAARESGRLTSRFPISGSAACRTPAL